MIWLTIVARASVPVPESAFQVPEPVSALALGEGVVVVGTALGVRALSSSSGLATSEQLGTAIDALLLQDRDGDGRVDVVACGPAGLVWMPWPAGGLQPALVLDPEPCQALAAVPGGLAAAGTDVRVYADDGLGGVLPGPVRHAGTPRIVAARGADVAWLSPGDTTFSELTVFGLGVLPVGGPATGLAASDTGWMLAWDAMLRDTAGAAVPLADPPGPIATGDFDLDGLLDTAIAYPTLPELGIRTAAGEARVAVSAGVSVVAAGDVDGDGCVDVAVDDPVGAVLVRMTGCALPTDADGDGAFTPEDCDDASNTIFPGAPEVCNAADDDCDGAVDEAGALSLTGPSEPPGEGQPALVFGAFDGCLAAGYQPSWTVDGPATCTFSALDATCTGADQGSTRVVLEVADADGQWLGEAEATVSWVNLPPEFGGRTQYTVVVGVPEVFDLTGTDVAADVVTYTGLGWPSWITLSPSGTMSVDAPAPTEVDLVLEAADEDGGRTTKILTVVAEPADSGGSGLGDGEGCGEDSDGCEDPGCTFGCGGCCGCGGGGGSSFVAVGVLAAVVVRRRGARGSARTPPRPR